MEKLAEYNKIWEIVRKVFEKTFNSLGYDFKEVEDYYTGRPTIIYNVFVGYSTNIQIEWKPENMEKLYLSILETDSPTIEKSGIYVLETIDFNDLQKRLKELEEIERKDSEKYPEYFV